MRLVFRRTAAITALLLCGAAVASAAPHLKSKTNLDGRCRALSTAINASVKEMSFIDSAGIGDNSAPRATMRAAQIGAQQAEIQNDILLMRANGCASYSGSFSSSTFLLPALKCNTALLMEHDKQSEVEARAAMAQLPQSYIPSREPTEPKTELKPEESSSVLCDRSKW